MIAVIWEFVAFGVTAFGVVILATAKSAGDRTVALLVALLGAATFIAVLSTYGPVGDQTAQLAFIQESGSSSVTLEPDSKTGAEVYQLTVNGRQAVGVCLAGEATPCHLYLPYPPTPTQAPQ
ncbi:hypothetical protein C5B42_05595 [Candidatus Cerribacteria bacterium 'Amazon FNV 2010 28 9']|uniref:Uncharacterized protein n=1 Tax=Candidatus Cerribacteria bacterium 'Amazon FNV 2010 28 9' TaxID=2081795 RepID=A0A317JN16_9BACT|nr:MAG: hypothetical protein C5B42_05595 [Candidatus Cerribacteria bacterium 'Amazon FNV 2010 28 9']